MKKIIKRSFKTAMVMALLFFAGIGVYASSTWIGSEEVVKSHTLIERISVLFNEKDQTISELRAELGSSDSSDTISNLQNEISKLKGELTDKDGVIRDKNQAIEDKEQAIRDKEQGIRDREQTIRDKEQAVRDKEQIITDKNRVISEKDTIISDLRNGIDKDLKQAKEDVEGINEALNNVIDENKGEN